MFNHAPKDYKCPICSGIKGVESEETLIKKDDLVYQDELVSVFINSFWIGKNYGHVIVVPKKHFENLYDLPENYLYRASVVTKRIALVMKKAYECDGITIRQNNEPAGDQHAFHYHLHIFPRYEEDNFDKAQAEGKKLADPKERKTFADKIRKFIPET